MKYIWLFILLITGVCNLVCQDHEIKVTTTYYYDTLRVYPNIERLYSHDTLEKKYPKAVRVYFNDTLDTWEHYRRIGLDSALTLWFADKLGCLGQRTTILALYLIDELNLKDWTSSLEDVLKYLGQPNEMYYQNMFLGRLHEETNFLVLKYYTQQICIEGIPYYPATQHSSIRIIIHPVTKRVVSVP